MIDGFSMNSSFKNQVSARPGGENLQACYLCGTCTAGCPVSMLRDEFNPRRIIRMVLLGMKEEVLASPELWQCTQCHACVAHCPQNVRFADVLRVLRGIALDEGYATKELAEEVEKIDLETKKQRIERIKNLTTR